jgi:hypothetical protein
MPEEACEMTEYDGVRIQMSLAARGGRRSELDDALVERVVELARSVPSGASVRALSEIADDPFPASNPGMRPYQAVLEIDHAGADLAESGAVVDTVHKVVGQLDDLVQFDLSTVVVGRPTRIAGSPDTPIVARYVYLMRRKAGTTHQQYLDEYAPHARFGYDIPGIAQYVQVHVDQERSRDAARVLGFGGWQVDSVTELYIASMEELFAPSEQREHLVTDSYEDELRFVDRDNSVQFCLTPLAGGS